MKILYDYQIFEIQSFGGISRYFHELISGFRREKLFDVELAIKYSNNYYLKQDNYFRDKISKLQPYQNFLYKYDFKGKGRINNILQNLKLINSDYQVNKGLAVKKIKNGNFDLFHPTYFNDYFLKYLNDKPFVITIPDMIYEIFPENFSDYHYVSSMKYLLASKASKIIAISNTTKSDIMKYFGIAEGKIEVIYISCSLENIDESINDDIELIQKKYILYVGNRATYKNFNFFIESISKILNQNHDLYVICTGGNPFTYSEIALFDKLKIKNQVVYYKFDDNYLLSLYKNAKAFVFPSLYEGFGIPILESFYCGCPVISSNSSSLPEIAGDAAMYFDPKDKNSILESVTKVLFDTVSRNRLRQKGYKRLKDFSKENMIMSTKKVYESI
jgi:glycosyltransferase involved in cell wall biosynthesis